MIAQKGIILLLSLLFLSFSGNMEKEMARKGKDHAVFFAVNEYQDEGWDDLKTPIKDAKAIANLLEEKYNFTTEIVLNPTKRKINKKLQQLSKKEYQKDEQLLLFFTGHGEFYADFGEEEIGLGYFIPSDALADDELQESYLPYALMTPKIDKIPCEHILVAIDACYSGSFFNYKNRPGELSQGEKLIQSVMAHTSRLGLTSGNFEPVKSGNYHSPFARQFMEALSSGGGADQILTITELYSFLEGISPRPQRGYFGKHHPSGDFLFMASKSIVTSSNDKDSDGIPNTQDDCPDEYGTAKANGCPDWDNDGIPNKSDDCPSTFGLASRNGCPAPADSDQDGIPDNADQCPEKYGPKQLQGCPDADGDNIPDKDDDCPNEKGIFANKGCPEAATSDVTSSTTAAQGTFMDSRDGQSYSYKTMKDGKKWMTQNLNYAISDSWCYKEEDSNCRKYGRLYTWAATKKACPSGWRLPSDDDWWKMVSYYGKAYNRHSGQAKNKEGDAGEAAHKALMSGGSNGFIALLGGYRGTDGSFNLLSIYGRYWSSTESGSSNAWFYHFDQPYIKLYRSISNKGLGFSCRCIQD